MSKHDKACLILFFLSSLSFIARAQIVNIEWATMQSDTTGWMGNAASLLMYEQEKENTAANIVHNDIRSSSYISFTVTPKKQLEIISTSFFQPLLNNWNDYRILNQASVRVKAGKKLGVKINWNYLNDSNPVQGIPSVNYTLSTGIDYDF